MASLLWTQCRNPPRAVRRRAVRLSRGAGLKVHARVVDRRSAALTLLSGVAASGAMPLWSGSATTSCWADEAAPSTYEKIPALADKDYGKRRTLYPDFLLSESGLQYKDVRMPSTSESGTSGRTVADGDLVVIDWSGYTIGYYGRIFEARNRSKGGSFTGDEKDFYRFRVGATDTHVIPAIQEAIRGMRVGQIRRIIVPVELGYSIANNDTSMPFDEPKPSTFSGQRSLDFVLRNQGLIDKTLLFDLEVISIK